MDPPTLRVGCKPGISAEVNAGVRPGVMAGVKLVEKAEPGVRAGLRPMFKF